MKQFLLSCFLVLFSFIVFSCQKESNTIDYDIEYIKSVEVITPHSKNVKVDNFARLISIDFPINSDITEVKIQLTLAPGVRMENPVETTWQYDLTKEATFELGYEERTILFRIKSIFFRLLLIR